MSNLRIYDIINTDEADTPEQGDIIYNLIVNERTSDKTQKIILDFTGINSFTSAFINHAIGKLFSMYPVNEVFSFIEITGLKNSDSANILQISIRNAINHFSSKK